MAEAPKKEAPKTEAKAAKGKKGSKAFLFFLLFLIPFPFIMPTLLICLGLLPTLIAMITDDDPEKSRAISIGAMNFAGVAPFLLDLWQKGQSMEVAFQILLNPNSWLIMLGSAAIGQLILFTIPPLVAAYAQNQAQSRLEKLEESLTQLQAIWGPEVATNEVIETVRTRNSGPK